MQWFILFPSLAVSFLLSLSFSIGLGLKGFKGWGCAFESTPKKEAITYKQITGSVNDLSTVIPFRKMGCSRIIVCLGVVINFIFKVNSGLMSQKRIK